MALSVSPTASGDEPVDREAVASTAAPTVGLRAVTSVPLAHGGFTAWAGMPRCDEDGNLYLLQQPFFEDDAAAAAGGPLDPRDVLRISADGKKRSTISPGSAPKFAGARVLRTLAMTLDEGGTVLLLVWAEWEREHGQYIVAFDQGGTYRFHLEVDSREIVVSQFEVFGSGDFLLRGRWVVADEVRMAVLPRRGGELRPVFAHPAEQAEGSPHEEDAHVAHLVRGGDGRIYVTVEGGEGEADAVRAISPNGDSDLAFDLGDLPGRPRLLALNASGDRVAITYAGAASGFEERTRWRIAVYDCGAAGGQLQAIYDSSLGPPVGYHYGSADSFTFLKEGKELVTMSPS